MTPFYDHAGVQIFHGDCLEVLRTLAPASVQCCVTSPPYWGLRDYGTASWEGGSAESSTPILGCQHRAEGSPNKRPDMESQQTASQNGRKQFRDACGKCGAVRIDAQLGLEATPDEYIGNMVDVFREVRRVLRDDGTLWLNMGDSYSSSGTGSLGDKITLGGGHANQAASLTRPSKLVAGLKPKDLVGIPWMLAFALRADGWYLRSDIIWAKPNPMPESVTDRPTKSHEYLFLLSKSERYFYDAEAIAEPAVYSDWEERVPSGWDTGDGDHRDLTGRYDKMPDSFKGSVPGRDGGPGQDRRSQKERRPSQPKGSFNGKTGEKAFRKTGETRNKRSVWTVGTQAFPEAHFATFPEDLIKPCILAGAGHGSVVLDPFFGAGTTGLVARNLHCSAIGIELNADYIGIAVKRLAQGVLQLEAHEVES